jgi:flagellar export protein FliJ
MSPRRSRIEKVVSHREQELERRVAALAKARAAAERVEAQAAAARRAAEAAAEEREQLTSGVMLASDWIEANEWLASRECAQEVAEMTADRARAMAGQAHAGVLSAHVALRGVERLSARLEQQEQKAEERAEQRLLDERAGRKNPRKAR